MVLFRFKDRGLICRGADFSLGGSVDFLKQKPEANRR
jgi:hypothetical protein